MTIEDLVFAFALPGKLAKLAYRPSRELQIFPWLIIRAGGFIERISQMVPLACHPPIKN
jgi:hypothetical protein